MWIALSISYRWEIRSVMQVLMSAMRARQVHALVASGTAALMCRVRAYGGVRLEARAVSVRLVPTDV